MRNILIKIDDFHLALTDFGLSRIKNSKQKMRIVPLRWCSPELWNDKKYTFETDIWAFGNIYNFYYFVIKYEFS
jgi:serine/threonine protein kinase